MSQEDAQPGSSKAPAIARAAAILRLLGRSDEPLGVQAIARALGLVPSTCLHVLRALVAEELIVLDAESKRYALGPGVLMLARQWLRRDRFTQLAQPLLDRLCRDTGMTALGVRVAGLDHMVVMALASSRRGLQLSAQVGSRFPALISATGRCVAAFGAYPAAELERRFAELRWDSSPGFDAWLAEVAAARRTGWAADAGNYIAGVTVLAAPVWTGAAAPSHALALMGFSAASAASDVAGLGAALADDARALSVRLGGDWPD